MSINKFKVVLIYFFIFSTLNAQESPYELSWKKDLTLYGIGFTGKISTNILKNNQDELTDEEIGLLNASDVNRFDRKTIGYYSIRYQDYSDVIQYGSYALPILFLLDKKGRKDFLKIGVLAGEVYLINSTITQLTKLSTLRTRPLAYNPNVTLEDRKKGSSKLSFFSGHTSNVSALSFFSAKVFNDYYPGSKWKPVVWSAAAILPAATGYFRVKGGKHFPTDAIIGYAVGAIIGVGIPHIHRKKKDPKVGMSISVGPQSVGFSMRW